MVYGVIVDKGEKIYTRLSKVFTAIGDRQTRYNWLITDVECYPKTPEFDDLMSNKYVWMTGEKLTEIGRASCRERVS